MSRIGKQPINIPEKVTVSVKDNVVVDAKIVNVTDLTEVKDAAGKVQKPGTAGALHGTVRAIIRNMCEGVATGYSKTLLIEGVGFKAALKGNVLDLALGYSHPIRYTIPTGVNVVVTDGTKLVITGADRHMVGQVASSIKLYKPVEPYKGKGVRVEGEFVRRKEGKKTA